MTLTLLGLVLACGRGPVLDQGGGAAALAVAGERVRFLAVGDTGMGNSPQRRVAAAMQDHCQARTDENGPGCDFLVLLGDIVYPAGVVGPDDPLWQSRGVGPYEALNLPIYGVLGNHDYGDPPLHRDRAAALVQGPANPQNWIMPGPWYAFDGGPVRFVVLDTTAVMMGWTDDQQADFFLQQSELAAGRPLVLLAHHPLRSNGQHGNAGEYEGSAWIPFASGRRIARLYEDTVCGRAVMFLSGHEHSRQWLEPTCGMELVVLGAGAAATPLVGRGNPTFFEEDTERGFGWFELTVDGFRGEILDEHGDVDFVREGGWGSH